MQMTCTLVVSKVLYVPTCQSYAKNKEPLISFRVEDTYLVSIYATFSSITGLIIHWRR